MRESTVQELTYYVSFTREEDDDWPVHVSGKARYHVTEVRARIYVYWSPGSKAEFQSSGLGIRRAKRIKADGTLGADIGAGYLYIGSDASSGAVIRRLEAEARQIAGELHRQFISDQGGATFGKPEPAFSALGGYDPHEYKPDFTRTGDPCKECGFGRNNPVHV